MTVDIEKLEALAKAAPTGPWYGPDELAHKGTVFDCDLGSLLSYESIESERDACVAYVAAANPAAVLELIAKVERLVKQLGDRPAYRTPEYESKRDTMWRRAHMVATSKGYDHINMAIAAAPTACADCMGCGGEWQGEGRPNSVCEICKGNRGKTLEAERDQLRAEIAGLKTGYEAYERVNAGLNQRIANLELCQTASLGVSGIIKSAASEQGFDAAGEDSALDYLIGLARSAAALRAECETLRNRQSFSDAFYEVSGLLGVAGARPEAPLVVFRQEVVPALEAVIRNSKRYEWLKQNATVMLKKTVSYTTSLGLMQTCYPSAMEVDAALDAAMSEEQSHD